jgi:large subunit ribosomal protein L32e
MRKHPKFLPPNYGRKKRIKSRWRKPRGIDNKKRIGIAYMGASPSIGWRSPRTSRGLHPSGMSEVLIRDEKDLSKLSTNVVGRFASSLGKKKRQAILVRAKEMGVRIVNAKNV